MKSMQWTLAVLKEKNIKTKIVCKLYGLNETYDAAYDWN